MKQRFIKKENKNIKKLLFLFITLLVFVIFLGNFYYTKFSRIISPLGISFQPKVNVEDEIIKPKIEKKENHYRLFVKKESFIPQAHASYEEITTSSAYILTDFESGEILLSKNKDKVLPIASLTKVMSAVVALDLANPEEVFTVTKKAVSAIPTKLGVKSSEKLTLKELIEAMLLTSANDAVQVAADGINKKYGGEVFVNAMNKKAEFLGLSKSAFSNPQGFDNRRNYSTVEDLAILTHYAMENYPLIAEFVKKDEGLLLPDHNHHRFDLPNWNGLIGVYPETIGMKIGNTRKAGKTTIVISNRGGKKLVAILLGAPTIVERDLGASQLLDYGYEKTLGLPAIAIGEEQLLAKYQTWYD